MKYIFFGVAILGLFGCGKNINNNEAVKAAVMKRVAKTGFDVNAMQVDVTQVSFHDQDAVATVSFIPKGGPAASAVTFKYNLHRQNDEWVATGLAQGAGMAPHGGTGMQNPGMQGLGPADPSKQLPSGHPPLGSQQQ